MENRQQLEFIKGLFSHKPFENGKKTIIINVRDKYDKHPWKIEVNANTNGRFVAYRVINETGKGLWGTWENENHVENWFKIASLI
jgi:hypothetical protein